VARKEMMSEPNARNQPSPQRSAAARTVGS
jgi:hypothetical protein